SKATLREGFVELNATFRCGPGELTQTFKILSVLSPGYRVILTAEIDGVRSNAFAEANQQTLDLPSQPPATPAQPLTGLGDWIVTGVLHIFGGPDHIAFLLGVLLVGRSWRQVLLLVTTFTVAHSITLAAAALDVVQLGPTGQRVVEAAIALSIV